MVSYQICSVRKLQNGPEQMETGLENTPSNLRKWTTQIDVIVLILERQRPVAFGHARPDKGHIIGSATIIDIQCVLGIRAARAGSVKLQLQIRIVDVLLGNRRFVR